MIRRLAGLAIEAVLGVAIAGLILLSLAAALDSAPFVYQGY
jgi:hypothetical protein